MEHGSTIFVIEKDGKILATVSLTKGEDNCTMWLGEEIPPIIFHLTIEELRTIGEIIIELCDKNTKR